MATARDGATFSRRHPGASYAYPPPPLIRAAAPNPLQKIFFFARFLISSLHSAKIFFLKFCSLCSQLFLLLRLYVIASFLAHGFRLSPQRLRYKWRQVCGVCGALRPDRLCDDGGCRSCICCRSLSLRALLRVAVFMRMRRPRFFFVPSHSFAIAYATVRQLRDRRPQSLRFRDPLDDSSGSGHHVCGLYAIMLCVLCDAL